MAVKYLAGSSANKILGATSITGTSENAKAPWSNLKNHQGFYCGRAAAAVADLELTATLPAGIAPDFCALFGFHDLTGITSIELKQNSVVRHTWDGAELQADRLYSDNFDSSPTSDTTWKLKIVGTPTSPFYLCKWALGNAATLAHQFADRISIEPMREQDADRGPGIPPINESSFDRLRFSGSYLALSTSERDEILNMRRDSKAGAEPIVVALDTNDDSLVLWARAIGSWRYEKVSYGAISRWSFPEIVLEEDVFVKDGG